MNYFLNFLGTLTLIFCFNIYSDSEIIEEVLVTGLKTGEVAAIDAPAAINAISGKTIDKLGFDGIEDFLGQIPGVAIDSDGNGGVHLSARSISGEAGDPFIGIYLDDTPFNTASLGYMQPSVNPFDLQQVEFLRGPQGSLYGAGAIGGVVRFLSNRPDMSGFDMKVAATISDTDGGGVDDYANVMLNFPLSDRAAARLVLTSQNHSGFMNYPNINITEGGDKEVKESRFILDFDITDNLQFRFNWRDYDSTQDMSWTSYMDLTELSKNYTNLAAYANPSEYSYEINSYTFDYKGDLVNVFLNISQNSVKDYFSDSYFGNQLKWGYPVDIDATELRISSSSGSNFDWLVGYTLQDLNQVNYISAPAFGLIDQVTDLAQERAAFFADVSFHMMDQRLHVSLGYRDYEDDRVTTDPGINLIDGRKWSDTHHKFNVGYDLSDNYLVYFTNSKGGRSGLSQYATTKGYADLKGIPINQFTDGDVITSNEVGLKGTFMDSKLKIDLTYYTWDWKGIIQNTPAVTGFNVKAVNAGDVENDGIEALIEYFPTDSLYFRFAGSKADPKYSKGSSQFFGTYNPATNDVIRNSDGTPTITTADIFVKGDPLGAQKDWTLNFLAGYNWESKLGMATANVTYRKEPGTIIFLRDPSQKGHADAFGIADLRINLETDENFSYQFFIENLTGEEVMAGWSFGDFYAPYGWGSPGGVTQPRRIGFGMRYQL